MPQTDQTWNAAGYDRNARYVSDLAGPIVELLDPQPGERILDLGCGDGVLTRKLAHLGCTLVGIDASPELVEAAHALGLDARLEDATALRFDAEFDAVFSNAVLHWIKDADAVIVNVYRALRPGGRFVAECGGHRCVETIQTALVAELERRGYDGWAANPWYFPTTADYGARLMKAGFEVRHIEIVARPTILPGDIGGFLDTFAGPFTVVLPVSDRDRYLADVRRRLEPLLHGADGAWTADYTRLRLVACKPSRQTL
jgi:trans-aconitate methyltransferase